MNSARCLTIDYELTDLAFHSCSMTDFLRFSFATNFDASAYKLNTDMVKFEYAVPLQGNSQFLRKKMQQQHNAVSTNVNTTIILPRRKHLLKVYDYSFQIMLVIIMLSFTVSIIFSITLSSRNPYVK